MTKGGSDMTGRALDCLLYVLAWLWNHPRMKYVRKVLYNFKLTVICGIITLLVFRGTVGAGKFGTLHSDVQIVKNFELRTFQENRLLQYANSLKLLKEDSIDSSKPYALGPTIKDWDEVRVKFIEEDPGCNETSSGKPLVMIVSGSQPTPCEHNVGDHLLVKFLKTKVDYARIKGMRIYYHMVRLDKEMTGLWAKLPLLRRLMVAHPQVEWFWWMDPDSVITDMKFEMPWKKYSKYNLIVPGWSELVYKEKDWVGLSTGSFLLRNTQWSLDLLEAWSKMGVRGKPRNDAGKLLTATLKGRPNIPADDQSALVYLMTQDKQRWGGKVHLESKYYLHGYWVNLVEKFEKMMEKYRPGYGDDRWPFVIHFVGCQLCGVSGEYDVQKCMDQMSRAFNFADNQVIKQYGYKHLRLNSSILLPTNETTRVAIVETHWKRKQLQKTRKEKGGEKILPNDPLLRTSADVNATLAALPPSTESLVEELLSEGVLTRVPGAADSGISSLHVVSTKGKVGGQKAGGQSVAWPKGAGQSSSDWRDEVEGIEEDELQEKRLEEAESKQLLKLEGDFQKAKEKEDLGGGTQARAFSGTGLGSAGSGSAPDRMDGESAEGRAGVSAEADEGSAAEALGAALEKSSDVTEVKDEAEGSEDEAKADGTGRDTTAVIPGQAEADEAEIEAKASEAEDEAITEAKAEAEIKEDEERVVEGEGSTEAAEARDGGSEKASEADEGGSAGGDTPSEETSAEETPAEETPAEETLSEEAKAASEETSTPAEERPAEEIETPPERTKIAFGESVAPAEETASEESLPSRSTASKEAASASEDESPASSSRDTASALEDSGGADGGGSSTQYEDGDGDDGAPTEADSGGKAVQSEPSVGVRQAKRNVAEPADDIERGALSTKEPVKTHVGAESEGGDGEADSVAEAEAETASREVLGKSEARYVTTPVTESGADDEALEAKKTSPLEPQEESEEDSVGGGGETSIVSKHDVGTGTQEAESLTFAEGDREGDDTDTASESTTRSVTQRSSDSVRKTALSTIKRPSSATVEDEDAQLAISNAADVSTKQFLKRTSSTEANDERAAGSTQENDGEEGPDDEAPE